MKNLLDDAVMINILVSLKCLSLLHHHASFSKQQICRVDGGLVSESPDEVYKKN